MRSLSRFLSTEGGHFVVSFILILTGAGLWSCGVPNSQDLILIGTGYMGRSVVGPGKAAEHEATIQHITDILREMQGTLSRVEEQTTKTNGRVGKLEERAAAVDIRLASRTDSCPVASKISDEVTAIKSVLTANTATAAATAAANKCWASALSPILYAVLGAAAMVVLAKGPQILSAIK